MRAAATAIAAVIIAAGGIPAGAAPERDEAIQAEPGLAQSMGISPDDIGTAGSSPDGGLSWENILIHDLEVLELQGVTVTSSRLTTTMENAIVYGDTLTASGIVMTSTPGDGMSGGVVSIDAARSKGPLHLEMILPGAEGPCIPSRPAMGAETTLELRGVTMRPPREVLPGEGGLPVSAPESIAASSATFVMLPDDRGCIAIHDASVTGVAARGDGGATATLASARVASDGAGAVTLEAAKARILSPMGIEVAGFDKGRAEGHISEGVMNGSPSGIPGPSALLQAALGAPASLLASVEGLRFSIGLFIPDTPLSEGRPAPSSITGDAALDMASTASTLKLGADARLDGLANMIVEAAFDISSSGSLDALASVMGDRPEAVAASRLSLVDATLSYEDRGANRISRTATGADIADWVDIFASALPMAPEEIVAPVTSWIRSAIADGGSVRFAPESPIGAIAIGIAAAMRPASLKDMLGVTTGEALVR